MINKHRLFIGFLCLSFSSLLIADDQKVLKKPDILPMSIFDQTLVLTWKDISEQSDLVDYQVLVNGNVMGLASENARKFSPAKKYMDKFYAEDKDSYHVSIIHHAYVVENVLPDKEYSFAIQGIKKDGSLTDISQAASIITPALAKFCDVTEYGALGDGVTLNTEFIQTAINRCTNGSIVKIPAGTYKTGALFLNSNTTLYLDRAATLLGSENPKDYPKDKGYNLYPYSSIKRPPSLINALSTPENNSAEYSYSNIRIIGAGTIDGNGWLRADPDVLIDEVGQKLPLYQAATNKTVEQLGILARAQVAMAVSNGMSLPIAYSQERSSLITLRGVDGVYIEGVTVKNPAFHGVMLLECKDIVINGVTLQTFDANNGDGIELGNSKDISIFNSFFDTGDDAVNFAAGTGRLAKHQPAQQNTWVFNNYFRRGHGAVVLGSHTGAWIENILVENNVMYKTDIGLRAKSNSINGGGGRNVVYRNNAHKDLAKYGLLLTLQYVDENQYIDYEPAETAAIFHDFYLFNNSIEQEKSAATAQFQAIKVSGAPEKGIYHRNLVIKQFKSLGGVAPEINGLHTGVFEKVSILDQEKNEHQWRIKNASNINFSDLN